MATYIHHIETVVPDCVYPQTTIGAAMKEQLGHTRKLERFIDVVYRRSGIDQRHTVVRDMYVPDDETLFFQPGHVGLKSPSTEQRNEVYTKEAKALFTCAAQRAVAAAGINKNEITHVITVSCTGFFAPGPEYEIVKMLGLAPSTPRFHVGFMGCFATFPALRMAQAFCEADPEAVVLVVSVELCTLHLQNDTDQDNIVGGSVFADGGAAAILSSKPPKGAGYKLEQLATTLVPEGEADMAWTIGNEGFKIILSSYVPQLLETNISAATQPLLAQFDINKDDQNLHWAVHPGGRAILDKVAKGLDLPADALDVPRDILKNYGNMSSATILFVLKAMLEKSSKDEPVIGMAFGPGLTVESGLFRRV